jgi:hypothetical protein
MRLRYQLIAALFTFAAFLSSAFAGEPDASKFGGVLSKYVSGGKVDYEGLRGDRADLDAYIKSVGSASGDLSLAFYLNAYNALVLAALLDSGPALPTNVIDLKGFFDAKKYKVAGKDVTLNELEGNARKTFKDARVHFAFNCGARSCPPLTSKIFTKDTVDKTLTDLTNKFLNGNGVKINKDKKEIQVTKLMDWYKDDFIANEGSIEAYLKKWVTDATKKAELEAALTEGYKITYQGYNWNPNKK